MTRRRKPTGLLLTMLFAVVLWQNLDRSGPVGHTNWTPLGTYQYQIDCQIATSTAVPDVERWHRYTQDDRGVPTEHGTPPQFKCLRGGVTP